MDVTEDIEIECPHCGEVFAITVETGFASCDMVEDCAVCCRPIQVSIRCRSGEVISVDAGPG